ncbi:putative phosphonate catabolism associated alcohol dehydrogenase [Kineosphaera limosa]|uniref:Putative zinc-containing alcohol dehydrogenase n=1 Tax=Kineosphaera limosa NBRC 100340 TaxID=1184609 RepID=K6WPQ2_9MICO|nr:alcohol dehydrogenase catalytic domain-containing protein [Kineosphaera limosa]NYE02252.1 putative phosphonate catabolism associated alcohol dehydrogenase [Kineosphaera limosa]GAB94107.1 putative zinc-containing alcohol dehydrogenase [Kineosphaera limosa NBRC 100340]
MTSAQTVADPLVQTVRAQVWLGGTDFEERTWPAPDLGPGEALAAVDLATVCGSDLHTVSGRRHGPHPGILGHESVGRIVAVGTQPPSVFEIDAAAAGEAETAVRQRPAQVGDRVVWGVTVGCGTCPRCLAGRTAKCLYLRKTGHEPIDSSWPLSGGYATHVHVLPGLPLVVVPEHVPDGPAAMSACALATVMACVEAAGGDLQGWRLLVVGAGMLGLCAVAVARARGAFVQVSDPDPVRREQAAALGALSRETDSGPVDVVIELSGAIPGIETGLAALDIGGVLVLAGSVAPRGTVGIDPEHVVRAHLRIVGVHNYEPRHLAQAVAFLAGPGAGIDWSPFIAEPVGLADTRAAVLEPNGWLRRSVAPTPHSSPASTAAR